MNKSYFVLFTFAERYMSAAIDVAILETDSASYKYRKILYEVKSTIQPDLLKQYEDSRIDITGIFQL